MVAVQSWREEHGLKPRELCCSNNITLIMQMDFYSCDFNEPTGGLPALEKHCIKSHFTDVEQIEKCIYFNHA